MISTLHHALGMHEKAVRWSSPIVAQEQARLPLQRWQVLLEAVNYTTATTCNTWCAKLCRQAHLKCRTALA